MACKHYIIQTQKLIRGNHSSHLGLKIDFYICFFFQGLPKFYKDILTFFDELKSLYRYDYDKETFLFNNREILVDGKPVFFKEWFSKGVVSVKDLLNESGQFISLSRNLFLSIIVKQTFSSTTKFLALSQIIC